MREAIREFIATNLNWTGAPDALTGDYELIENDVVDSMGLFKIVTFLENQGIEIDDDELIPDNFATIDAIARLVDKSRESAG